VEWLLKLLVGPGVVAAVVSLYFGARAEKQRARRDFLTKSFAEARDTILKATEYAIDYFSTEGVRSPKQEAYVSLYEREVRKAVLFVQDNASAGCRAAIDNVTIELVSFLALLTGGDFQSAKGKADLQHIRELGFASAALRSAMNDLRDAELRHDMDRTLLRVLFDHRPAWIGYRGYRP
jgi:hypothetical protein